MRAAGVRRGVLGVVMSALCALMAPGCQGDIELASTDLEMGGVPEQDLAMMPDQGMALEDQGDIADQDVTPRPDLGSDAEHFLFSRYEGEMPLVEGERVAMPGDGEVRGVAHGADVGTFFALADGLYELDQQVVRRRVMGDVTHIASLGERSIVYLMEGVAYLYEGGEPRELLGGVEAPGVAYAVMQRGQEVWVFSDVATWRARRDPLKGDTLEQLAPLAPRAEALWGSDRAEQLAYRSEQGEIYLLDLSKAPAEQIPIAAQMGSGVTLSFAHPTRSWRVLGGVAGQLTELESERWWWRSLQREEVAADSPQIVTVSQSAYDTYGSASWLLSMQSPDVVTRVESSWVVRASLPQGVSASQIAQLFAVRGRLWMRLEGERDMVALDYALPEAPALLDPPSGPITFEEHIRPIADASCKGCHINGQGAVVVHLESYADWSNSAWINQVIDSVDKGRMPKEASALPAFAELLKKWKEDGLLER